MRRLMVVVGLMLLLVQSTLAFRPAGWVYSNYPWAYDSTTGDWYWFSTANTQWVVKMGSGQWAKLQNSALASGWCYYNGAFAYAQGNNAWHWINSADTQWVVNMRRGVWSLFGVAPAPAGMSLIPGGTNTGTDPDFGAYSLTVNTFYMDKYEVTKALWDQVYAWAGANGYSFDNQGSGKGTNHPVHTVSWYDCVKWCNARSESEGRESAYYTDAIFTQMYRTGQVDNVFVKETASGYRLPTEQQWEYSARGGTVGKRYPWGDAISHDNANYVNEDYAYHPDYDEGLEPYTSPVGSFAPNGYGLFDMSGNVAEWCEDLLSADDIWRSRIVRGGWWAHRYTYCRVGYKYWDLPGFAEDDFGFRTVLPAAFWSAR